MKLEKLPFGIKNVTVFGMGMSGISALKLLKNLGLQVAVVSKGAPESWAGYNDWKSLLEPSDCLIDQGAKNRALKAMAECELIVLSPGIPREHELLEAAIKKNIPVWSEIELADRLQPRRVAAITGSNGKTTTTTLLGLMLKKSGMKVFIGGNIGLPYCESLLHDEVYEWALLELSSFQLESMPTFHPKVAAILNVVPHHGERYKSAKEYAMAKMNVAANMCPDDTLFIPSDSPHLEGLLHSVKAQIELIDGGRLEYLSEHFDLTRWRPIGHHNQLNLFVAVKMAEIMGASHAGIQAAIDEFQGVEHRFEFVRRVQEHEFINDAKSTNWQATESALTAALDGIPVVVILGGKLRGENDLPSKKMISLLQRCSLVVLIGEAGKMLSKALPPTVQVLLLEDLESFFKDHLNGPGPSRILLSPAFSSYDQYRNFEERGNHFKKLVSEL